MDDRVLKNIKKYWDIIHWDPTIFNTEHYGYCSDIFYDRKQTASYKDILSFFKKIVYGVIQLSLGVINGALIKKKKIKTQKPYLLLYVVGGEKYAFEESAFISACDMMNLGVITVYSDKKISIKSEGEKRIVYNYELLNGFSYLRVIYYWLSNIYNGVCNLIDKDPKRRSLFVASLYSIRQYYMYQELMRRIDCIYGVPRIVFSMLPSVGISRAIVKYYNKINVLTAGIRTQTTSKNVENLSVNTKVLFCKSIYERAVYEKTYYDKVPVLVNACLLSLPVYNKYNKLDLPKEYVLILGTVHERYEELKKFNDKLLSIAKVLKLPIVFKSHNESKYYDELWFSECGAMIKDIYLFHDIKYNKELIDKASVVISCYSTLLYYIIMNNKPFILIYKNDCLEFEEFSSAPIIKYKLDNGIKLGEYSIESVSKISSDVNKWFKNNYFLENNENYIVQFLIQKSFKDLGK